MRKVQYTWKPGEKRPESVQILLYEDIQKFLKRLRKAYRGKLRYFVAGEYGEQTARPHYHMILYGWEPTDLKNLYKIHHNGYYTSKWLTNLWGMGQIQIAQAVPVTIYCLFVLSLFQFFLLLRLTLLLFLFLPQLFFVFLSVHLLNLLGLYYQ